MIKLLIFKILIIGTLTFLTAVICKRFDPSLKVIVLVLTAMGAVGITFLTDLASERLGEPKVRIEVTKGLNELLIRIEAKKSIKSLAIDLPVVGRVTDINDYTSVTEAKVSLKRVVGQQIKYSQNNIELLIEDIKPKSSLQFKVLYEPMPGSISIAGSDRYKISYEWLHNGNIKTRTKWISFKGGQEVNRPNVEIKGFGFQKRALSVEELKKKGLNKETLDNK
jgi:hypothetical protein